MSFRRVPDTPSGRSARRTTRVGPTNPDMRGSARPTRAVRPEPPRRNYGTFRPELLTTGFRAEPRDPKGAVSSRMNTRYRQ